MSVKRAVVLAVEIRNINELHPFVTTSTGPNGTVWKLVKGSIHYLDRK